MSHGTKKVRETPNNEAGVSGSSRIETAGRRGSGKASCRRWTCQYQVGHPHFDVYSTLRRQGTCRRFGPVTERTPGFLFRI